MPKRDGNKKELIISIIKEEKTVATKSITENMVWYQIINRFLMYRIQFCHEIHERTLKLGNIIFQFVQGILGFTLEHYVI